MNFDRQYGPPKYLRDVSPGELFYIYNDKGKRALALRLQAASPEDSYFFSFEEFVGIKPFEITLAVNFF